ncbi:flavin reductase family protein [Psychrobacter sp. ANT_WB68]|uniref:flavin reductase family protein n=1 Tax=Psychrobacter sp. ANT_WB68 TaxID=2597355 RepID=UPI0011F1D1C6|nr:2Fe-2S iron-sulfur cluster-binding protein [Psychrobacter sp. ANT_WB68]KAA0913534.1 2Fe-2S iron-sulfur cluster binding domain-containing protein [Psychrobacter sp. ANT_WB68]
MTTGYRPELIQRAFVDFISTRLHPFWSLTVPKLRLIARRTLSDDLIALQFEPNRAFKQQVFSSSDISHDGWHGGQHINISILIDGIYHQRYYSLVGLPQQPLWWHEGGDKKSNGNKDSFDKDSIHRDSIDEKSQPQTITSTITIAVKPQGLVSDYLSKHAALGTIFNSSLPSGEFTLAHRLLEQQASQINEPLSLTSLLIPLLFIAGGSGITPMPGLITQALQNGHQVTLLHYSRTTFGKSPLQNQWQQLSAKYPTFIYHLIHTEDPSTYIAGSRHLSAKTLIALKLPLIDTQIFACGSATLLSGLYRACDKIDLPHGKQLRDNITIESFSTIENFDHILSTIDNADKGAVTAEVKTIYLHGRQRQFNSSTTLLLGAESAGIRLNYGCRQGICQLCRCNKISGRVKNIQTGKISNDGYESIQTCINVAVTDVVLDI